MTVGPRIVFTRFASSASPKLRPWRDHVRSVTGVAPEVDGLDATAGSVVVWNLVSANNRELGRGARIFQRFADAVTDAEETIARQPLLVVLPVNGEREGVYGWKASFEDAPELICARWYQSSRDRHHSMMLALTGLASASLREGARLTHPALMAGERAAFDD